MTDSLQQLADDVWRFADERDWHRFHAPKNIASALVVEAGELLEPFQWLTEAQSDALPADVHTAVADEMADVLLYLVQLGNRLGIDPVAAARAKLARNAGRFPALRPAGALPPWGQRGWAQQPDAAPVDTPGPPQARTAAGQTARPAGPNPTGTD